MLTLGSLFDGLGGWQLAAVHNGVKPIWSSEIEKFPCAVTKHHFPDTIQLGDITKIKAEDIPPVDIVCAGSPCQDLSLAGKREGLDGERSGLFRNAVDIVRGLRLSTGGRQPRFFVWENVPGAFSSNSGMDFRCVLETIGGEELPMPYDNQWASAGMVRLQECEIAWRTLDAQYWGVPQRRKRIFLVADFGGRSAGEILFDTKGVCGDSSPSRTKRQRITARTQGCIGAAGGYIPDKARSIIARADGSPCIDRGPEIICYNVSQPSNNFPAYTENGGKCPTLISRMGTGGNQVPIVHKTHKEAYCIGNGQADGLRLQEKAGTLNCMGNQQCVMIGAMKNWDGAEISPTLTANNANGGQRMPDKNNFNAVTNGKTVRRLTPVECERLQGLPDNYTLIDDPSCSDTSRYKALGNGMAQPCADYVIRRIAEVAK